MTTEWKKQIAIGFMIKERIRDLDQGRLWALHYPELAASEEQLGRVEAHLGFSLPVQYRQFLECANGWQCFFLNVDLFGVDDLLGSDRMAFAMEAVEWLEADNVLASSQVCRQELLPIGMSREDNNLFCISISPSSRSGEVLWFSGKLIDRFSDFREFFLAMCDYNRLEVDRLVREQSNTPK
jgi:hypothetical protein